MNISRDILSHFTSPFFPAGSTDDIEGGRKEFAADSFLLDGFTAGIWTPAKIQKKRKRRSGPEYTPEDRCSSMFYRNYIQPAREDVSVEESIRNEYSKKGRRFRRRFRVPYCIFEEICASLVDEGYYKGGRCANGWLKVELELLVLASLRLLGSGSTFDLAEEFTNVSAGAIRSFFQKKFWTVVNLYLNGTMHLGFCFV